MDDKARITKWRGRGLVFNEEEITEILNIYHNTKNCNLCNQQLTNKNEGAQKCMDHDHKTGKFRQILCKSCNIHYDRKKQVYKSMSDEERKKRQKILNKKQYEKRKTNPKRIEYNKEYQKEYKFFNKYNNVIYEFLNDINNY